MAVLQLEGVRKAFGGQVAVDGVSLTIEKGQFVSLLGPSGCGKTTTLRLIAGFLQTDAGEIRLGDRVLSSSRATVRPEHREMSMIFQAYALWPHMTVFENVAYGLKLRRVGRGEMRERVGHMLQTVRLEGYADRYPAELSGGQQQRVALARALVVEPDILLLDEPLSNLDANLREEMRVEIRRLHEEFHTTSIYVTHDQAEAMALSDRMVVMNHGRIEQIGPPHELYAEPESVFVAQFIGRTNLVPAQMVGPGVLRLDGSDVLVHTSRNGGLKGPAVTAAMRPGDIRLSDRPEDGGNVLACTVVRRMYLGDVAEYHVQIDGTPHQLRVVADPLQSLTSGNQVYAHIPPDRCFAFAADSEPSR